MDDIHDHFEEVLQSLYDGVYVMDRSRRITFWNRSAERISGYSASEVTGRRCSENVLTHVGEDGCRLCLGKCPAAKAMEDGKENETRVYLHHKSGFRLPVMIRVSPLRDARGEVIGAVEIFSDNSLLDTSLKKIRDLETQAFSDALTELPNRRYAEITLGTRQDQADRYGLAGFGVIFADVDRFKSVNDTYGHETGDLVLRMVAGTLKYGVRDGDVVCRWGGEEFVAIVGTDEERVISDVAERLRALIAQSSLDTARDVLRVTASFGATMRKAGEDAGVAVKRADALMYASKQNGRNRVTVG
jgi:diguanylate cyclase (GGDEF)-like protein/PAS domain S-box-containing protein